MEGAQAPHLRSPVTCTCLSGNLLCLVSKNKIEWESIPMSSTYSSDSTDSFTGNALQFLQALFRIREHTQAWLANEFYI